MPQPRFTTLGDWLAWQETLHHSEIELGLERVARVAANLIESPPRCPVITVAGTNGKGSVLAFLEAMLSRAGYLCGLYTSPHFMRYNERVRIGREAVTDAQLVAAFDRVDEARGDTSLTYFEFGTLAALDLFQKARVQVLLLEVGMGGRLDAVNIVDADVAVIASVGLDHQAWLGDDREAIGREKAGIMRSSQPVVCGEPDPPRTVIDTARRLGARLRRYGRDFGDRAGEAGWQFWSGSRRLDALPEPVLPGGVQRRNAAVAIEAIACLGGDVSVSEDHIRAGLGGAVLPGRIDLRGEAPQWLLDVCHNPEAAEVLAGWLAHNPVSGKTRVILGMLSDKDVQGVVEVLSGYVDVWYLASLPGPRGLPAARLAQAVVAGSGAPCTLFASVGEACAGAEDDASRQDRIIVCGSFLTVGSAMARRL